MCGYLGIVGNNIINGDAFNSALNKLQHRGPDESKILTGETFNIGFKRLKILDLSENGSQPMSSVDSNVTIVFNVVNENEPVQLNTFLKVIRN